MKPHDNASDPPGSAGLEPTPAGPEDTDAARLAAWQQARRDPVFDSDDRVVWAVLAACWQQQPLPVRYRGGTDPGGRRTLWPRSVFTVHGYGGTWCEAWCEARQAIRTFRLDRILIE